MITLTFDEFKTGDWTNDDSFYQMYIISDQNDYNIFYIGISEVDIYNRWFGLVGHIPGFTDSLLLCSHIGSRIVDNVPESSGYIVKLLTLQDAMFIARCADDDFRPDSRFTDIRSCETVLIKRFLPPDNSVHNASSKPYTQEIDVVRRSPPAIFSFDMSKL